MALVPADHDYAKAWVQAFAWPARRRQDRRQQPDVPRQGDRFLHRRVARHRREAGRDVRGRPSEPTALVVKQARELGFKGGFIVMDQAKMDEMAKVTNGLSMLEGSIGVMPLVNDTRPAAQASQRQVQEAP